MGKDKSFLEEFSGYTCTQVDVRKVSSFVLCFEEAAAFFKAQDEATNLPYIYLSAGVSAKLFQETLVFAHESGANFNGVLCGRATWAGSVEAYIKDGEAAAREWLRTTGFENIEDISEKGMQTERYVKRGLKIHVNTERFF